MKHIVFGLVTGSIAVMFVVMLSVFMDRNVRREELENSLAEAMETTMLAWQQERQDMDHGEWTAEKLEKTLVQYLAGQIASDSELIVEVLAADSEKGLLSARAVERFRYPVGQEGEVECTRTILADSIEPAQQNNDRQHTVRFYLSREDMEQGSTAYKQMVVMHGDSLIQPGEPRMLPENTGSFVEWRDAGDYLADFSQRVEEDLCYYAVFE